MTAASWGRADAPVPVLDVGGTHVTAALVDPATSHPVPSSVTRRPLGSHADADGILDAIALAALHLPTGHGSSWGVAMPGPFDYDTGVGRFAGIGKFESLSGVNVGAGLRRRLAGRAERLCFLNDADAFALGEYRAGAAEGHDRVVCLTLGTGIGSSFLRAGLPVHDGPEVPPHGHVHRLDIDGRPLEETVSRRALRIRYAQLAARPNVLAPADERALPDEPAFRRRSALSDGPGPWHEPALSNEPGLPDEPGLRHEPALSNEPGLPDEPGPRHEPELSDDPCIRHEPGLPDETGLPDVHEIAVLAGQGDPAASAAFRYAFDALGRALAPWIDRFEATVVVVGGSMAQSWDLIHPAFAQGLARADSASVRVLPARQPAEAPLIGAAHWVQGAASTS